MGSFQSDRCYLDDGSYQDIRLDASTPICIADDPLPSSQSQHNNPKQSPNESVCNDGKTNRIRHNNITKDIHANVVDKCGGDTNNTTTYSAHISPKHKVMVCTSR